MTSASRLHLLWRAPLLVAFGGIVLLGGLASLTLPDNPHLAAALDPLRTDARIETVIADLSGIAAPGGVDARNARLAQTEAYARRTLALAPGDARALSAIGAIEESKGNASLAERYYDAALELAKTEILALSNRLSREYAAGNYAATLDDADLIMRRWFRYRGNLAPVLAQMTSGAGFGDALIARLDANPPWRQWLVEALAGNENGLAFLERLLIADSDGGRAPPRQEIAWAVNGLLAAKDYARAYRLFVLTLDEPGRNVSGLVHDAGFDLGFGATGFEWTLRQISTAEASIRPGPGDDGDSGLRVRFLDSPTQLRNISQLLVLPAGPYSIAADVTAQRLVLPRGLFWDVQCAGTYARLGRLEIDSGSYRHAAPRATFEVPPACPAQVLTLSTDQQVESFRQQYKGSVVFGRLEVAPAALD